MNADGNRALLGVYLVTALFSMQTVQAKPPTKDLENRVAELEATAVAVQAELDSINATINQLQTELAAEAATREAQVNQLDGRITTNESAISGNSTTIANDGARISTNESDIVANSTLIEDNANLVNGLPKTIVVLDSNDKRVGIASSREDPTDADVFFDVNGRLISLTVGKERFVQGPVEYDQLNCLGTPHVYLGVEWMAEPGFVRGASVFRPIANTTPPPVLRSVWRRDSGAEDGICVNTTRTEPMDYLPAEAIIDLSEFTPPFKYSVAP